MFSCRSISNNIVNDSDDSSSSSVPPPTEFRVAVGTKNPVKLAAVQKALSQALLNKHQQQSDDNSFSQLVEISLVGYKVESKVRDQPWGDAETCRGAQNRAKAAYTCYRREHEGQSPHLAVGIEGGLEWVVAKAIDNIRYAAAAETSNGQNATVESSITVNGEQHATAENSKSHDTTSNGDNNNNNSDNKQLYCNAWIAVYGRRLPFTVDALACNETKTYHGDKKPVWGLAKTALFALPNAIKKLIIEQSSHELSDADDAVFGRSNSKHGQGTVGKLTSGLIDRTAYYEHAVMLALIPWIKPDLYPHGVI